MINKNKSSFKTLITMFHNRFAANKLNCKNVCDQILRLTKQNVSKINQQIKVVVILAEEQDGKPNPASEIYVNKKLQLMPTVGISSELIRLKPNTTKENLEDIIKNLNEDPQTTSVLIQLPFPDVYKFNVHDVINQIKKNKNIDGFSYFQTQQPNLTNPKVLKPPTALGITALINYYGIQTQGKNITIVGKGSLVGGPLTRLLESYPFSATVTTCDIFTQNIKQLTKKADIIISACGQAQMIKEEDIKQNCILIDAGINQKRTQNSQNSKNSEPINFTEKSLKIPKRRIIGDISSCAYTKAKFYTPVPGGVGLLTVAALAFNVLNSYFLQKNLPVLNLNQQIKLKNTLNEHINKFSTFKKSTKIMLLSSSYNGLTQRIDRTLQNQGYQVYFQVASSESAMRNGVNEFQPDLIICPTLMKAIPEDIYKKIKCLIVHPGIKGDRGPSSIDWAILNKSPEWGVTLLQADKQMDAGDIWESQNFRISQNQSKVEVYNLSVVNVAQRLILKAIEKFQSKKFQPQKLDYTNPKIKGNLHRTIKLNDPQRTVNWMVQTNQQIMKKALAADTQPGLKVNLLLNGKKLTRFTYGYVEQKSMVGPQNIQPGEIFLQKHEAVCVKTKQGAVWIKQMRLPKNAENPHPFKTPSTLHLKNMLENIPEIKAQALQQPNQKTFQQITFIKKQQIGVLGFDFYNGAMSTLQCKRLAQSLRNIKQMKDVKILILKGSHKSWSNGINLNVIEAAQNPSQQAWYNICAINQIIKEIYKMNDKIVISAMQANAGAGGVYLGLAADYCFGKQGIVLNPHYKNMGLYGSQLHTAIAAQKIGFPILNYMKDAAKPLIVKQALELKIMNELKQIEGCSFIDNVLMFSEQLASDKTKLKRMILKKSEGRKQVFKYKSLQQYEKQQLDEMKLDMFQNRNGFKQKRQAFVKKL